MLDFNIFIHIYNNVNKMNIKNKHGKKGRPIGVNRMLMSFTFDKKTINKLNEFAEKKSINKSKFIDRIINEAIDKEEKHDN